MKLAVSVLVLGLLTLSGFADAIGFVYASRIWQQGELSWPQLARSAGSTGIGILLYYVALRPMSSLGVNSAELQTTVWFAMTIIGVVIFSGRFFAWPRLEQSVAVCVLAALGWLLVRTAD